jgi:two-component system sensor histidine kinase YesM
MRRKFFYKNFISFIIPIFIPVLIFSLLALNIFHNMLRDDIDSSTYRTLNMSKDIIESVFSDMNLNKILIDYNPQLSLTLLQILKKKEYNFDDTLALRYIYPFLKATSNSKLYIDSIYINIDDSDYFLVNGEKWEIKNYSDQSWHESYKGQQKETLLWTEKREVNNREFISIYQRTNLNGVIVINVLQKYFNTILNSITAYDNQAIMVLNENDELIFSNKSAEKLPLNLVNQFVHSLTDDTSDDIKINDYYVSQIPSAQYKFKYISFIPNDIMYKTPNLIMKLTILSAIVSLIISFLLAYYFTRRNFRQISNIVKIFEMAEQGKTIPSIVKKENDAYTLILNHTINTFVKQSYLSMQLSERKYRQILAEAVALQYQINPHFLFNTLQSINFEILNETKRPVLANTMIEHLSDILRYSLDSPTSMVEIREEIQMTQGYINIQKYRHDGKFDVVWDYEDEVLGYKTLRLLLQPILENAIQHGIQEDRDYCRIKVKIKRIGELIQFTITDNGNGMSKERLKQVLESLAMEPDYERSDHIGLKNTNARIKLTYGDDYFMVIRSKLNLGTSVTINIKLQS